MFDLNGKQEHWNEDQQTQRQKNRPEYLEKCAGYNQEQCQSEQFLIAHEKRASYPQTGQNRRQYQSSQQQQIQYSHWQVEKITSDLHVLVEQGEICKKRLLAN